MSEDDRTGHIRIWLARTLSFQTRWAAWIALSSVVVALVGGWYGASQIRLEPRLESLLDPNTPSQLALKEVSRRFSSSSPLYIVVQSEDPEFNRRFARHLQARFAEWDEVLWAIDQRDPSFFLDRRLLYVDAETLHVLAEDIDIYVDYQQCERLPGCVQIDDDPPEPNFDTLREAFDQNPELGALVQLFGSDELPDPYEPSPDDSSAPNETDGSRLGELCSFEGRLCLVQAVMRGDPSDLQYATRVYHEATRILQSETPLDAPDGLQLRIEGRYQDLAQNTDSVAQDLSRTIPLSLGLVLLVLLIQFRTPRAFALLLIPLVVGAGLTLLAVGLLRVELNLVSAATLGVLAGLGIDFGVHLLTHYGEERSSGLEPSPALRATLSAVGPSLVGAAMTTSAGFLALAAARFEGFAQMGPLAALGIVLTLFSYLLLFAPLVHLLHKLRPERGSFTRKLAFVDRVFGESSRPWVWVATGLVLLGVGAGFATQVEFEYELGNLRPPSEVADADKLYHGGALHGTARSPIVMLGDSQAHVEEAADVFRERYPEGLVQPGPWLITPSSFMPENGEARVEGITSLREAVGRAEEYADEELQTRIEALRPLLNIDAPITAETLPPWVRDSFAESNGEFGTIGVVYASGSSSDARKMEERASMLTEWRNEFPHVKFANAGAILGEVVSGLRRDAPVIVGLAFLGLFFGTLVLGRSLKRTLMVLFPVLMAVAITMIPMALLDVRLNLFNLVVFPLAFGIGVDGAIYVVWGVLGDRGSKPQFENLRVSGRAVLGSTLTTMAAFFGLLISVNPGIRSLGSLAVLCMGATLLANLLWLPAALRLRTRTRE